MDERIKKYAEEHIDELKKDIADLCAIPSVLADADGDAPFGRSASGRCSLPEICARNTASLRRTMTIM